MTLSTLHAPVSGGVPAMLARPYKYLNLEWNAELGMLRVRTCVKPIQCYSLAGMTELQRMLDDIAENPGLVRHFVLSSDVAGVFNFGGDLALFVLLVRAQDIDSLKMYGRRCVDLVWWMETAALRGVHTTVLVQGDTLGGGLESVLPFHKVIFERSAQAGFPEVLFNLFPGMGAWQFTIRKAGFAVANDMILTAACSLPSSCCAAAWWTRWSRTARAKRPSSIRCAPSIRACAARWRRCARSAWPRRSPTNR